MSGIKYSPELHEKIIKLLKEGKSIRKVNNELNLSNGLLGRWIKAGKEGNPKYIQLYEETSQIQKDIDLAKFNAILDLLKKGYSNSAAAREVGIYQTQISQWIKKAQEGNERYSYFFNEYKKIRPGEYKNRPKYSQELHNKIINLLKEGHTLKSIEESVGISQGTIKHWVRYGKQGKKPYDEFYNDYYKIECLLNKHHVKQHINSKYNLEIHNQIINYRKKGYSLEEISEKLNINSHTLEEWLRKGKLGKNKYIALYNDYVKASEK